MTLVIGSVCSIFWYVFLYVFLYRCINEWSMTNFEQLELAAVRKQKLKTYLMTQKKEEFVKVWKEKFSFCCV